MTKVVNLHQESYDVYIGRAGRGQDGYFGNPIRTGSKCMICGNIHRSGADTLPCYRIYFYERLKRDPDFKKCILELKEKTLGCFCKPRPCHGDIIAEYLDNLI